jgi:hypothetical protein
MTYEVYAVKYAHHPRRASGNFIGGDPHDGPMPLDYFVWLVRGHGRELVVDTGFSAAMAAKRGRQHHLQELEMRYATGRYMCQECFSGAFEAEDVVGMVRRVYEGRVRFHDGDAQLMPGVSLHLIGGHTMGLQVARVERPFPIVWSVADMVDGYRRLRALAESPAHVIPGHDPLVLQRYPAPAKALEGVVARLD